MDYWEYKELRHSADDTLAHKYGFKYIKRYKSPSGKWVYVYDDKNGHADISNYKKAVSDANGLYKSMKTIREDNRKDHAFPLGWYGAISERQDADKQTKREAADAIATIKGNERATKQIERRYGYASADAKIEYENKLKESSIKNSLKKSNPVSTETKFTPAVGTKVTNNTSSTTKGIVTTEKKYGGTPSKVVTDGNTVKFVPKNSTEKAVSKVKNTSTSSLSGSKLVSSIKSAISNLFKKKK